MSSSSLTKQAAFLMAGRVLALPLAFLVPIVLVRYLSMTEFGHYKQLLLIFYLVLPILDFGITNSLYYFIPKYPTIKNQILSQTFIMQLTLCIVLILCFYLFRYNISALVGEKEALREYIPFIGVFAALWHFSMIMEVALIAEKNAFAASIISFSSDTLRSLLSIIVVVFFEGKLKELLVFGLILTGIIKTALMFLFLAKRKINFWAPVKKKMLKLQILYALPFGLAVIVMGFVGRSHSYIVTLSTDATAFAIYSVGCFQLPLLGFIVDSIAKASLVRMTELTKEKNGLKEIALIVSNGIRKLWILFFPIFIFLFINAEELVILLFTKNYIKSIPVFKVFIIIIPLSAFLLQHVPRVFAKTNVLLLNNLIRLFLSIIFCLILIEIWGIRGAAIGYVMAEVIWKAIFLFNCKKLLQTTLGKLVPIKSIFKVISLTLILGWANYLIKDLFPKSLLFYVIFSFLIYNLSIMIAFWKAGVLIEDEKNIITNYLKKTVLF